MEYYQDIIIHMLPFLEKDGKFNLTGVCKQAYSLRFYFYGMYVYNYNMININSIKRYIKYLKDVDLVNDSKCINGDILNEYRSLIGIHNCYKYSDVVHINSRLKEMIYGIIYDINGDMVLNEFIGLENLVITGHVNNIHCSNLPNNIKTLVIDNGAYNKPLNSLPTNLEVLAIKSSNYNQPIDKLPLELKYLFLSSDEFSYKLDKLPHKTKNIALTGWMFSDDVLNSIPNNLDELSLHAINISNFSMDMLISKTKKLIIGGKEIC